MSAQPALAVVPDTEPAEFDGGDPHAGCAEAFRGFLVLLNFRIQELNPEFGELLADEIVTLLETYKKG